VALSRLTVEAFSSEKTLHCLLPPTLPLIQKPVHATTSIQRPLGPVSPKWLHISNPIKRPPPLKDWPRCGHLQQVSHELLSQRFSLTLATASGYGNLSGYSLGFTGSEVTKLDGGAEGEAVHIFSGSSIHLPSPGHGCTLGLSLTGSLLQTANIIPSSPTLRMRPLASK
jgi:hypothetical protein